MNRLNTNFTFKDIISVIRLGLDMEVPVDLNNYFSFDDQKYLLEFGKKQSILPIIFRGLQRVCVDDKVLREYETERLRNMHQHVNIEKSILDICSALNSSCIQYVVLKGISLGRLYPCNELRTSCDIDILVREDKLKQAILSIENNTDFKYYKSGYHDISMINKFVNLELHFSLKENMEKIDYLLGNAWNYTIASHDSSRLYFTNEFTIFYVIAHMLYHFLNGGLGVRPFIDLWYLRNKTNYDENIVLQMCETCGIKKFYQECSFLPEVWFNGKQHSKTSEMLEFVSLSGGVYGSPEFNFSVRQNNTRGILYFFNRIIPDPYQVREFYKDPSGRNHLLLYYYLKRLFSWFGRKRRKRLKNQLVGIFSVDKQQIYFAKELLNRLEID